MEHPRTTSARDHDDSAIIGAAREAPSFAGGGGGNLQRDIASQAELDSVDDPANHRRVQKQDAVGHGNARRKDRPRGT